MPDLPQQPFLDDRSTTTSTSHLQHPSDPFHEPPHGGRMQTERNGAVPMPVGGGATPRPFAAGAAAERAQQQQQQAQGLGPMGMTRSPPKNKNIQHVPCKFFIYGQCQAGMTCPFSHDIESTTRPATCKYFSKGACKFGRKCALLHVAPDGTVVNRPGQFNHAKPQQPFGSGAHGSAFAGQAPPPPGLLAQGLERRHNGDLQDDHDGYAHLDYQSISSQYGSPVQDSRFTGSPPPKGFSVLDAPLPNSFDSNGISMAARNGPFAASVPSRFGVESPPSSLPRKSQLGNTALRDLHTSAFGGRGMDGVVLTGSSPPSGPDEPLTFPKRPLVSERLAQSQGQIISASLGTKLPTQSFEYSDDNNDNDDEDEDSDRENDLLPASLRDLIPDIKSSRRTSRSRVDDGNDNTPAGFLAAQRRTLSGHGTPPQDSKVGSPHNSNNINNMSSSPSRYSGMFARSRGMERENEAHHVGSPLRNSGLIFGTTTTTSSPSAAPSGSGSPSAISSSLPRTTTSSTTYSTTNNNGHRPGDLSPTISSPPRQASMSMLTQELQRTKLDAARSHAAAMAALPGNLHRSASNGSTTATTTAGGTGRSSFERTVSGLPIGGGGGGAGRERLSEEQVLFDMDEGWELSRANASRNASNGIAGGNSGGSEGHGWGGGGGKSSGSAGAGAGAGAGAAVVGSPPSGSSGTERSGLGAIGGHRGSTGAGK